MMARRRKASKAADVVDSSWSQIRQNSGKLLSLYYQCSNTDHTVNKAIKEWKEGLIERDNLKEEIRFHKQKRKNYRKKLRSYKEYVLELKDKMTATKLAKKLAQKEFDEVMEEVAFDEMTSGKEKIKKLTKKIKKLENKIKNSKESSPSSKDEEQVEQKISEKEKSVKSLEKDRVELFKPRDDLMEELKVMMSLYDTSKCAVFVSMNDVAALRFMMEFGDLGVTFKIGKSLTVDTARQVCEAVQELAGNAIEINDSKRLFQLTRKGTFRALTEEEMNRLKFKR